MKYLNEYKTYALLPKELRNKSLLYHATTLDSFEYILKENELYGTHGYDFGVATSRNKHYNFGNSEDNEEFMYNQGDVQLILDKDKLKNKYKTSAFDWEEWKSTKSKTGIYNDYHQSEDKILTNNIKNIKQYIIGIHIAKHDYLEDVLKICKENNFSPEYIFDEDWDQLNENTYNDLKTPFKTKNTVIALYDQEYEIIAEFEFYETTCIGLDYSPDLEEYSVGHEISDSYHLTGEKKFKDFYDMINNILVDYNCLVDIDSSWFDFVDRFFPEYYDEELKRHNKFLETDCSTIINDFEYDYRKEEKRKTFNL
jgi:hypothetical protein